MENQENVQVAPVGMFVYTKSVEEKFKQYLRYKENTVYRVVNTAQWHIGEKRTPCVMVFIVGFKGELIGVPAFNLVFGETYEELQKHIQENGFDLPF